MLFKKSGDPFMNNRLKIIFILLIIQPLIDLITALFADVSPISAGAFFKTGCMLFLMFYIFLYLYQHRRNTVWLYLAPFAAILLTLIINFLVKSNVQSFAEINFALKTCYYLVMIYTAILLIDNKFIDQTFVYHVAKAISLIIGISYWLAILTGTGTDSYSYVKTGYSGWFYAANELSVTVLILLALTMIAVRRNHTPAAWLAFLLMVSMVPMIGTKTAFGGGIIIIGFYTIYLLFSQPVKHLKEQWIFFGVVVIFICLLPFSPMATNTGQSYDYSPVKEQILNDHTASSPTFMSKILSARNIYFKQTKDDFDNASMIRKVFGLGYAGDYTETPKIIEMDFFDLFFSYGVAGSILLLSPLIFLCVKSFSWQLTIEKSILLLVISLCFGIAFLAGHVLFAPSVMTYVTLLFIALGLTKVSGSGGLHDQQ